MESPDPYDEACWDPSAVPGLASSEPAGLNPVELVIDGETFRVSQRPGHPGWYDVDWLSHPDGYGFGWSGPPDWTPSTDFVEQHIRDFLAEIDPETGYLRD